MPRSATGSGRALRAGGFTLLETMVVLAIVGLAFAVIAPNMGRLFEVTLASLGRDLQVALRDSRASAVTRRQASLFWFEPETGRYGRDEEILGEIPQRIGIRVTGTELAQSEGRAGFLFFPDGSSTGGSVSLSDQEARVVIEVDWLTGRVAAREAMP